MTQSILAETWASFESKHGFGIANDVPAMRAAILGTSIETERAEYALRVVDGFPLSFRTRHLLAAPIEQLMREQAAR